MNIFAFGFSEFLCDIVISLSQFGIDIIELRNISKNKNFHIPLVNTLSFDFKLHFNCSIII